MPAMPHICGSTAVCTSAAPIAASTTLPPARNMSMPASTASGCAAETMPCVMAYAPCDDSLVELLLGVLLLLAHSVQAATLPAVEAANGMVVTAHRLASEAGIAILQQGGNAIDAAVAVGYAEAVVNPCCGNIGGGGFMVAHLADGRDVFLNFRETAPAAATRDMYLDAARQRRAGREPAWLARRRGARHGAGTRHRADAIRHAAAIGGDGAGHPPGTRRLRADPLRHRHPAARHGVVSPRAERRADLPASRTARRCNRAIA